MSTGTVRLYLLGEAAQRCGVQVWQVQALVSRGLIAPRRVGRYRVISEDELPALRDALRAAGYLPQHIAASAGQQPLST
jgi:DNA-binding transcriptional MerR regulator